MTRLETARLVLRPPVEADIPHLVALVGPFEVSKNLSRVPHPYTEVDAKNYIAKSAAGWQSGEDLGFSILRKEDGAHVGMCALHPSRNWEIGYNVGVPYWGRGYATEAAACIVAFGFDERGAQRLAAEWFHDNPASGRVLEKLGFERAGEALSNCLARGHKVPTHVVVLDRATYLTRKMAP